MKKEYIELLSHYALNNPKTIINVVCRDKNHCDDVFKDFYYYTRCTSFKKDKEGTIIYCINGSGILFCHFNNENDIRGTHRDICFLTSLTDLNKETYYTLKSRTKLLFISEH